MGDRGRKNQLCASPMLQDRWKTAEYLKHRQRLQEIKPVIDTKEPVSTQHKPSSAKKEVMKRTRQEQIDYVSLV